MLHRLTRSWPSNSWSRQERNAYPTHSYLHFKLSSYALTSTRLKIIRHKLPPPQSQLISGSNFNPHPQKLQSVTHFLTTAPFNIACNSPTPSSTRHHLYYSRLYFSIHHLIVFVWTSDDSMRIRWGRGELEGRGGRRGRRASSEGEGKHEWDAGWGEDYTCVALTSCKHASQQERARKRTKLVKGKASNTNLP